LGSALLPDLAQYSVFAIPFFDRYYGYLAKLTAGGSPALDCASCSRGVGPIESQSAAVRRAGRLLHNWSWTVDRIEVFLSSKQSEFVIERGLMVQQIKTYSMLEAVNAEDWSPEATPIRELMIDKLNRSMIYVGLFGSIYSEATELEYRAALVNPYRERMIYIKNIAEDQRAPELRRLLVDLQNANAIARFNDVLDLLPRFADHLRDALVRIALKLRMLGERLQPARAPGGVPRYGISGPERSHPLESVFAGRSPEDILDLARRIEMETVRPADHPGGVSSGIR